MTRLFALAPVLALALSCTREQAEDKARAAADEAQRRGQALAGELGDKAGELGDKAGERGKALAGELGDQASQKGAALWAEHAGDGQLSAAVEDLLSRGAAASGQGVESLIAHGEQLAPAAAEVCRGLAEVVDGERIIEPIVQDLADEQAQRELDERIADMPRVETFSGVDVGFKELTQYDTAGRSTESAYLILWRREDKLVGLVYRSRQRIELDVLLAEAPRLLALAQGSL
ncbi:hypothetical protein G6O69_19595 [Pseudenhygromyxa sp. WMMC2535]|nr:hypothetical protein [Pseudenhygromyxa sp. WMMC2535]